jgi:hypothetical protein
MKTSSNLFVVNRSTSHQKVGIRIHILLIGLRTTERGIEVTDSGSGIISEIIGIFVLIAGGAIVAVIGFSGFTITVSPSIAVGLIGIGMIVLGCILAIGAYKGQ